MLQDAALALLPAVLVLTSELPYSPTFCVDQPPWAKNDGLPWLASSMVTAVTGVIRTASA